MKVIVCGGRDFRDSVFVHSKLNAFHVDSPITEIIEGGARAVDFFARQWGELNVIPVTTVRPDWSVHGRKAGPIRNANMLKLKPDCVIAFPGGKGTANMIMQATVAGVPVVTFKP